MKRTANYLFILLFIGLTAMTSCSKDDGDSISTDLSGTSWKSNTDNTSYVFTSSTDVTYQTGSNSTTYSTTYEFDGTDGHFGSGTVKFKINGSVLSVNREILNPDYESIYIKQ